MTANERRSETPARRAVVRLALAALGLWAFAGFALAQTPSSSSPPTQAPGAATRGEAPGPPVETARGQLYLSATLAGQTQPLRQGLAWRIYRERAQEDGTRPLVAESNEAAPSFALPDGAYVAHVTYGLASAMKRVVIAGAAVTERLTLNAGALRVKATLGEGAIPAERIALSVFVPDAGNSEAKLVVEGARPGDLLRLPEGNYHVVSTYLDAIAPSAQTSKTLEGAPEKTSTNSVVSADVRVPAGKLIDLTLKHRAATMTLKLVNAPGGESLPNTLFTVLTPGGDVIRELRGAFPSLVLAEGEYVVIARYNDKTYQTSFRVTPALDRDVEIVAK